MVYVAGDYSYGESIANKRGVVLSTDAGVSGTDMTMDGTDPIHPNALHPDQHSIVTNPNNPFQFFETGDGGIVRSSGALVDRSSWCASRNLPAQRWPAASRCCPASRPLLTSMNKGLSTLQFQSLSVSHFNSKELQGGTQDNGTWENYGSPVEWHNTMVGDGGQSGFDVAVKEFRFHNFTGVSTDVNFNNGALADWIWISDGMSPAGTEFYAPVISDPVVSGSLFAGNARTVYRTKTFGLGTMTLAQANQHCNEWTGDFTVDLRRLGRARLRAADGGRLGRPGRRRGHRHRADDGRHDVRLGGHEHRSGLRVDQRRRRSCLSGHVDAHRRRCGHAEPARELDLRRPRQREPRLDLVQRLQRQHPGHAWTRFRGDVQPGAGTSTWRIGPTTGATCQPPTSRLTR